MKGLSIVKILGGQLLRGYRFSTSKLGANQGGIKVKRELHERQTSGYGQSLRMIDKQDVDLAEASAKMGDLYSQQGKLDKAINAFTKSVKLHPSRPLYQKLLSLYDKKQDPSQIIQILQQGLRLFPEDEQLTFRLAEMNITQRDNYIEAFRLYRKMVESKEFKGKNQDNMDMLLRFVLNPGDENIIAVLMRDFRVRCQQSQLLEIFRQALGFSDNYHLNLNTSLLLLQMGNSKEAKSYLLKAIEVNPENYEGLAILGQVEFRQNNLEEAANVFKLLQKLRPEESLSYTYLGLYHYQKGEISKAYQMFKGSICANKDDSVALSSLGKIQITKGQELMEGINNLERALELDPTNKTAVQSLKSIQILMGSSLKKKLKPQLLK